jgi:hypothetical protein
MLRQQQQRLAQLWSYQLQLRALQSRLQQGSQRQHSLLMGRFISWLLRLALLSLLLTCW